METIRVRAVSGLCVARLAPTGGVLRDSWVGRNADGSIMNDGEEVARCAHYLRAIRRGELELVEQAG
jgi:hypothetical protein